MAITSEVADAIEALYVTFGPYPLHADTNACPCCHRPEQEQVLHSKPLRELAAEDLRAYAGDAILVWGDVDDFKHFLPRIFELMVQCDTSEIDDPPIVFARLRYADWLTWPREETTAVRHYLTAVWAAVINSTPDHTDAEDWLCGIVQAEEDLQPYLTLWEHSASMEAGRHLATLLSEHNFIQVNARAGNFWAKRKDQFAQVRNWLLSDAVKQKLKAVANAGKDDTVDVAMQVLGLH